MGIFIKDQVILPYFIDVPKTNPNEDVEKMPDNEIVDVFKD